MLLNFASISQYERRLHNLDYDDIYFNPQQGFAESDYVFIQGNDLSKRFAALRTGQSFTIAETGFGSGMNFILAAEKFFQFAPASSRLYYISCEKNPITLEQLKTIQEHWPLPQLRHKLYQYYPHNRTGFHLLPLSAQIDLLLLWGDANQMLPQLQAKVDAWFLDGFAPSKNPDLWSAAVFSAIAANSHEGTSLATFSVAAAVKTGLQQAGFAVEKRKGFGCKREMLTATFPSNPKRPLFWTNLPPAISKNTPIHIIGAGLAGVASAWSLANKGYAVKLYDSPLVASASQVPLAIAFLQTGLEDSPMRRFHLAAWRYNRCFFANLCQHFPQQSFFYPQEIILKAENPKIAQRHQKIAAQQIFTHDEYELDHKQNLILKGSGLICPPDLLTSLRQHPNIDYQIRHIQPTELAKWTEEAVIFASAWHQALIPKDWHRHLRTVRGQACIASITPPFQALPSCGRYSIFPFATKDKVYIGSSYQANCQDSSIRTQDNEKLMQHFQQHYPQYHSQYHHAFAGIRASTRDYLPLIGPIPDAKQLRQDYRKWHFDRNFPIANAAQYPKNWYFHAGLGSKGCLTAFLGAEILAAIIEGNPLPIEQALLSYLLPARCIIREIIYHQ